MNKLHALAFVAVAGFLAGASGCAKAVDTKAVDGTYNAMVSAFGKTDTTIFVVAQGANGDLIFDFAQGFSTAAGATNETGIRGKLDGDKIDFTSQEVHVDHSTGEIDGALTGVGTTTGTTISLTFDVTPSSAVPDDDGGTAAIDYEIMGTRQQ